MLAWQKRLFRLAQVEGSTSDPLLEEYRHVTTNAQQVTQEALSLLGSYLLMFSVFVYAFGSILGSKEHFFNPYVYLMTLVVLVVLISEKFKQALLKLRYSFINWAHHASEIRARLLDKHIRNNYKTPLADDETSLYAFIIRIVGIIVSVLVIGLFYVVTMMLAHALGHSDEAYPVAITLALCAAPFVYYFERLYDFSALHEIAFFFKHFKRFPPHKASLTLAWFPIFIMVFGLMTKSLLKPMWQDTGLYKPKLLFLAASWFFLMSAGFTYLLHIAASQMWAFLLPEPSSRWVCHIVIWTPFAASCLIYLWTFFDRPGNKSRSAFLGILVGVRYFISLREQDAKSFDCDLNELLGSKEPTLSTEKSQPKGQN